jgi:heme oxygenase
MPDVTASTGSVRDALRAATEAVHLRLHAIPAFEALAAGRLSRAGYAAVLRHMLGFHAALEARLAAAPSLLPYGIDVAARARSHLLRADLVVLGASPEAPLAPMPAFASAAAALGALYVAEGSTLGGRQLARALDAILPPGLDGRRFLLGHGERHGEMWRACCAAIEACGAKPGQRAVMVQGARDTFAAFETWFGTFTPAARGAAQPAAAPSSSPVPL